MTQHDYPGAGESWRYYRSAFSRRSLAFPALAVLGRVIDRVEALGYSERLYASQSLDQLVISVYPKPRDRRRTILIGSNGDAVEFRIYPEEGAGEVQIVALDQVESAVDRLLPRLVADQKMSSSGVTDGAPQE